MTLLIRATLRQLLGDSVVIHECRGCGTKLEADIDICPTCGSEEIARYDLGQA